MTNKAEKIMVDEFADKVLAGLELAAHQLVEVAAANNESLIVGDKNGKPIAVPAKELLKLTK